MSDPTNHNGAWDWLRIAVASLVVLVCLFFVGKGLLPLVENFLPPREPKLVPQLTREQLKEKLQAAREPVFVLFYHSSSGDLARYYFPALNQLANRFKDKISFYRYQLSQQAPDPFFDQYWKYEGVFVLFKNGQEAKQTPIPYFYFAAEANRGFVFLFIKDYTGIEGLSSNPDSAPPINHVNSDNFQELVLDSKNLVLINFLASKGCTASMGLQSDFKQAAVKYRNLADFCLCDATNYPQLAHVSERTTVALFYQGKFIEGFDGAYPLSIDNEAAILGLLVPYL